MLELLKLDNGQIGIHYSILSKCIWFEIFHNKNVIVCSIENQLLSGLPFKKFWHFSTTLFVALAKSNSNLNCLMSV